MEQKRSVRSKSYGVIRDLLDNADDQGGMQSCTVYVAATPEMFQSERGFPEYEALRSRLVNVASFVVPNLVDWRGVIVDLTKTPLPHDLLLRLANRIIDLHAAAWKWDPREYFTDDAISQVVDIVERQGVAVTKPRLLASCVATLLEIVEQNREQSVATILKPTLSAVKGTLSKKAAPEQWE